MVIRPKLFLTFLVFCLAPLILTALVNYWVVARSVESKLTIDHQRELADFKSEVARLLNQDQSELLKLGQSQAMRDYLSSRRGPVESGASSGQQRNVDQSVQATSSENSADASVSHVIPVDCI